MTDVPIDTPLLPSTQFDIHLVDGGQSVDLTMDLTAHPVDAYYFSLLTAFESRATKCTIAPGKVIPISTTDDDSGDLLDSDLAPVAETGLALSRSALGVLLRQSGLFLSGEPVVIADPPTSHLGQALLEIVRRFASLNPSRPLSTERVDGSVVYVW